MKLSELPAGQSARIVDVTHAGLRKQLEEFGLMAGHRVSVEHIAPLGCPIILSFDEMKFSLRSEDASHIIIRN